MFRIIGLLTAAALAVTALPSPAPAQVHDLTIVVQGMSCPFCAFGVEKKLRKVDGVASVTVDMKDGTAALKSRKGQSIDIDKAWTAVKESGFTPGKMSLTATGRVKKDERQGLSFQPGGSARALPLADMGDDIKRQASSLAETGRMAEIRGSAFKQDGGWTLIPESIKEAAE